jgi:hypothetical protein
MDHDAMVKGSLRHIGHLLIAQEINAVGEHDHKPRPAQGIRTLDQQLHSPAQQIEEGSGLLPLGPLRELEDLQLV